MATAKRAKAPISVPPAVDPGKSLLTLNVFDGTRQLIAPKTSLLVTITDGAQLQLYRDSVSSPTNTFSLPFYNNFADNYSVVAYADSYEQAGFQPVTGAPTHHSRSMSCCSPKTALFTSPKRDGPTCKRKNRSSPGSSRLAPLATRQTPTRS